MADPDGVIVVAGAAGGIGRAVVADCLARSATVAALVHHPTPDPVSSVPEFAVDITDRAAVFAAIDRVADEVGSIAGLVNTSAVQDLGRLVELTEADWNTMIAVNLTGAHHLTQAVATSMAAAGRGSGSIVHIASIEGHRPAPAHGHYGASKAALISYVKSAAAELGPLGLRVNSISPGLCHRAGLEADWPEGVERWRATAPLGRLVTADEVARVCWFFLSDQSAAVTGADLVVDAGVMATAGW